MAPTEGAYGPSSGSDMDMGTIITGQIFFGPNLGRTVRQSRRFGLRCKGSLHAFALLAEVCVFVLSLAAHTDAFSISGGFVLPVGKLGAWKSLLSVPRRRGCFHGKEPSALPRLSVNGLCRLRASSYEETVSNTIVEVVEEPDPVKQGKVGACVL